MTFAARFRWFLVPSILQAGISFLTLPFATLWLGPADYGSFALVSALASLGCAISCLGSSYVFATVYSSGQRATQMGQAVSQQLVISGAISIVLSALLIYAWPAIRNLSPDLEHIPQMGVGLAAASMMPTTLWALAADVLTLDGRAKMFAMVGMAHSLVSAAVLLGALYWTELEGLSLFLSNAVAAFILGVGACVAFWRYLELPRFWSSRFGTFRGAASITASNVFEMVYPSIERNLLTSSSGLAALGLFTHAQQYRAMVLVATKSLARAIWSVTLTEAQQKPLQFTETGRHWNVAYLALGFAGLAFAAFGSEMIGILTHGKFSGAGPYAAMGLSLLLIQNSGKACTGYIYAKGKAAVFAQMGMAAGALGLVTAVLAIPAFGLWGAVFAMFAHQLFFRIAMQLYVSRYAVVPFQDACAAIGFVMISSFVIINELFTISLLARAVCCAALFAMLAAVYVMVNRRAAGELIES